MKILQVKKFPVYDIFTGEGWDNWTRVVQEDNNNVPKVIGGGKLTPIEREAANRIINLMNGDVPC